MLKRYNFSWLQNFVPQAATQGKCFLLICQKSKETVKVICNLAKSEQEREWV